jgi:hypothetical protein
VSAGLVPFTCPVCGAIVYTVPTATVGHYCRHVKGGGRRTFIEFKREAA